jgi:LPS export ABC transporter protein LptC
MNKFPVLKSDFLLIFSISALLFVLGCSNDIKTIGNKQDLSTFTFWNIERRIYEKQKLVGKINGTICKYFENNGQPYYEFPEGIIIMRFDQDGKVEGSLTSKYGIYYESVQTWTAKGNVILTNSKNGVLETELLKGDNKTQKIITDKPFRIITLAGDTIKGSGGLETNYNAFPYTLHDVSALFNFTEYPPDTVNVDNIKTP